MVCMKGSVHFWAYQISECLYMLNSLWCNDIIEEGRFIAEVNRVNSFAAIVYNSG